MDTIKASVFLPEDDQKIAKEIANKILPLLDGLTANQIKIAFKEAKQTIKLSAPIKFERSQA
jgi:hypothetical protein